MLLGKFQTPNTRSSRPRAVSVEHAGWNIFGFRGIGSGGRTRVICNLASCFEFWGFRAATLSCLVSLYVGCLLGFWGIKVAIWQIATFVWALGVQGRNLELRLLGLSLVGSQARCSHCLLGFWGIEVATWQVATFVWALGDQGRNLASCNLCLGFGGSGLQLGKVAAIFWFLEDRIGLRPG
ncbi:hypothetical protein B0H13DRAFT_2439633 [Mycena leptocephala]|nr:hypothetical protein B0H13DRAFT_2439633 [Mycena leptocephala]